MGIIIPVPKSGDKSRTDHYRGITLQELPVVVKIFLTIFYRIEYRPMSGQS